MGEQVSHAEVFEVQVTPKHLKHAISKQVSHTEVFEVQVTPKHLKHAFSEPQQDVLYTQTHYAHM